jgi:hypothetical protein
MDCCFRENLPTKRLPAWLSKLRPAMLRFSSQTTFVYLVGDGSGGLLGIEIISLGPLLSSTPWP